MKVLEAFRQWFNSQTGILTVLEPQALEMTEPTFRLNLAGFDSQGENREKLELVGTLTAHGDGPDVFLDAVIEASRAVLPLRDGSHPFEVEAGFPATATFTRTAPGRFQANTEENKYGFSYIEQFRVELSYNPAKL